MQCRNCGHVVSERAKRCPNCGEPVPHDGCFLKFLLLIAILFVVGIIANLILILINNIALTIKVTIVVAIIVGLATKFMWPEITNKKLALKVAGGIALTLILISTIFFSDNNKKVDTVPNSNVTTNNNTVSKKSISQFKQGDQYITKASAIVIYDWKDVGQIDKLARANDEAALQSLYAQGKFAICDKGTNITIAESQPMIEGYTMILVESGAAINKDGYINSAAILVGSNQ